MLASLAGGCMGGDGEGGDETVPALRAERVTGPLGGMVVARDVDERGNPVDASFTFAPDEPQMTVLVQVAEVTGSPLTITWYRGDERLFEHVVEVKSFDRAFSVGESPERLAPGTYRAVATLEGKTAEVDWEVQGNEDEINILTPAAARTGGAPTAGESGVVASPARETLFDTASDPGTREYYGDPGKYFHGDRGCMVALTAWESGTDLDYEADTVGVRTGAEGCEGGLVVVTAGSRPIASYGPAALGAVAPVAIEIDPCSLAGGSDLPGATVRVRAEVQGYTPQVAGELSVRLGDDTLAPRVLPTFAPEPGSQVERGDAIKVKVLAQEKRRNGPWQTGVQRIQVTGPNGLVGEPADFGRLPKKCAEKQWEGRHEVTYTVPGGAPNPIELCAIAEDFAGNEQSSCGAFFTGEVWEGTIMQRGKPPPHTGCSWTFQGPARLAVATDGSVAGRATGEFTEVVGPCTGPVLGRGFSLRVSGSKSADSFDLTLSHRGSIQLDLSVTGQRARGSTRVGGYITWTLALTCATCDGPGVG